MSDFDEIDPEMDALIERLKDDLIPFICERTGLSRVQVEGVFDADHEFWASRPNVLGHLMIFQFPDLDEEPDDERFGV